MEDSIVSKKTLFYIILLSAIIIAVLFFLTYKKLTTVVFCDVGQGDGIYIRTQMGTDLLIDAGPNNAILNCLGEYMPFYDHTIEYAILSHAHLDHYGGFEEIANRYSIKVFFYSYLPNVDPSFNYLVKKLKRKGVNLIALNNTDVVNIDNRTHIKLIWPTRHFLSSFDEKKDDLNDTSLTGIFSVGNFDILFTGDISPDSIDKILSSMTETELNALKNIEMLKVPHHGSVNGLTPEFLDRINPYVSIASVGQKNKFNHPSRETVQLFKQTHRTLFTTAEQGTIVVKIHNGLWSLKTFRN